MVFPPRVRVSFLELRMDTMLIKILRVIIETNRKAWDLVAVRVFNNPGRLPGVLLLSAHTAGEARSSRWARE
jgi:hypothetical protein